MNPQASEKWKSSVLDEIFIALAASQQLDGVLVFKGARVLNARMQMGRQSLDLDSNLAAKFVSNKPDREAQRAFLEEEMAKAIRRRFERQTLVQYELTSLTVTRNPKKEHPRGWDAFSVKINVEDLTSDAKNLPALAIDVASPEELLETSVSTLQVGGHQVAAYTLERIAGEKLRAFLSTLPAYEKKMGREPRSVRVKDLYDITRIYRVHSLEDVGFWKLAAKEFQVACRSRFIDCLGRQSFQEDWSVTQKTYEQATIPKDVSFEEVESTLLAIVFFLESEGVLPFTNPLS